MRAFSALPLPPSARAAVARAVSSPLRRRLARGLFWSASGAVGNRLLALVSSIVIARLIGRESFGALGVILSTVGMIQAFAGLGLGVTATKHVAEFRDTDRARAGRIIVLASLLATTIGGLGAILLLLAAPWLAAHTLAAPELTPLLRVSAAILFFASINAAQTGALMGMEAFRTLASLNVVTGALSCALSIGGAWSWGLRGAVWAAAIGQAAAWILFHVALRIDARRAEIPLVMEDCLREAHVLWHFSIPAAMGAIMVAPVNWACNAIIINGPGGYAAIGIYNAATQWLGAVLFIPGTIAQAVVPILSERVGQRDRDRSRKILTSSVTLNALLVTPLVIIGCLASPYLMGIYGNSFRAGWPTLVLVLLTAAVLAVEMPVGDTIVSHGRMWTGFLMNLGWAAVFIVATLALRRSGAPGLAGARLTAYVVHGAWTVWVARRLHAGMAVGPQAEPGEPAGVPGPS